MKVRELIDLLQGVNQDAEVLIRDEWSDYLEEIQRISRSELEPGYIEGTSAIILTSGYQVASRGNIECSNCLYTISSL